jgi:hypothetical protein
MERTIMDDILLTDPQQNKKNKLHLDSENIFFLVDIFFQLYKAQSYTIRSLPTLCVRCYTSSSSLSSSSFTMAAEKSTTNNTRCFYRYPSIEAFPKAMKHITKVAKGRPFVEYVGYPKIHGTNGAIVYCPSKSEVPYAQSRNRVITSDDDHADFATYVDSHKEFYANLIEKMNACVVHYSNRERVDNNNLEFDTTVLYGEWCGQGIQKDVAVAHLSRRFIVFDVCFIRNTLDGKTIKTWLTPGDACNHRLDNLLCAPEHLLWNIFMFPTYYVSVDVDDPMKSFREDIEPIVKSVVNRCPVGCYFGVEGLGEGIVWTTSEPPYHRMKTKADTWHLYCVQNDPTLKGTTTSTTPAERMKSFLDTVVTTERLEQGIDEVIYEHNRSVTKKHINAFTKWIIEDVEKEHKDLCEDTFQLSFKRCKKNISKRARQWYINQLH